MRSIRGQSPVDDNCKWSLEKNGYNSLFGLKITNRLKVKHIFTKTSSHNEMSQIEKIVSQNLCAAIKFNIDLLFSEQMSKKLTAKNKISIFEHVFIKFVILNVRKGI